MSTIARMKSLWRNIFAKHRNDRELDAELRSYLDQLTEDKIRAGIPPEEARRAARIELGGLEQVKENVREVRAGAWLDSLLQDLRFGARMLRKNPGFTAVAVLTLALGIGANTAIFTLTYAVILKSLPVPNPQQLVHYTFRSGSQDLGLSGPVYDALRKHEDVNQDLLAWSSSDLAIQENGAVTNTPGALMSGNGFRVLELQPSLGRSFTDADDEPGGGPNGYQALLSHTYWTQHLHANPDVLGQSLSINGKLVTVIGVLPAGFDGLVAGERTDILLPLSFEEVLSAPKSIRHEGGRFWLTVMGRLKPDASLRTAHANLLATLPFVRAEADPAGKFLGGFFAAFQIGVESGRAGRSFLRIAYTRPLIVLEFLVGLLLLLCCANTSLLVLARMSSRSREFAVRRSLGAPRRRLFRQVLSEVALLAFCGLVAGVALGWAAARSLVAMLAAIGQPPPLDVAPQAAVLAFTAAIGALSAVSAGVWPAVRASRAAPILGLKQSAIGSPSGILGKWIVPVQVSVSVVLLAAASLLGETFLHLLLENSGFRPDGAVMAEVVDPSTSEKPNATGTRDAQQLTDALANTPGVDSAGVMSTPPLHDWWTVSHYYSLDGHGTVHTDMQTWAEVVSADYFAAIGTPILAGRGFAHADSSGAPVCVLSASAAQYFFPGEQAIGRFVSAGGPDPGLDGKAKTSPQDTCQVIGVAADARFQSLREPAPRSIFHVIPQSDIRGDFFVVVRSHNPQSAASAIREAVRKTIPGAADPTVFTFNELVAAHLRQERMLMSLSACFAGVALLLTALGLYGLLSRSVVLRTKEIGLRLALGAQPRDAVLLVLRQGLGLVLAGCAVGLLAAFGVTKLLLNLLFGPRPSEPILLLAAAAALFLVALAATCIPAWRAARVDPMEALRYE